jgi:pimeloyl-ACP methyl ester carboxylesterase
MSAALQPTLILLHGATINGHMWDPIKHELDSRYRVITPDLPGHGSRRNEPFTLTGAVATVTAAAASVAPSPFVVGGDSLGGYSTLASAASLPQDRLKGLILCGSSSNLTGTALLPYLMQKALIRTMLMFTAEERLIRTRVRKSLLSLKLEPEDVEAMLNAGISLRVFNQAVDALRDIDFRAKLAAVEQPVVIINGGKDRGHIRQEASFVAVAREATTHRLEGCEHGVTLRRPHEVAAMINQFAARVFASAGRR